MVNTMSTERSVEVHVPADLPVADRRRQITHAAAEVVDKLVNQEKYGPEGLILTIHRNSDAEYPTLVVTATVPEKLPTPARVD